MNANITRIDPAGRLSISAQHRKALGLESGGPVVVTLVGDEVRIRSLATAMSELQADAARFLQDEQSSVDAFIAERNAEAVRDEGEFNGEPLPPPPESVPRAAKKPERKVAR
jgi:bifunctional DNA-binding transcriptional regulator/antitoxin component of YhaV-PrlF toxin-antitoxin module